MCGIAGVLTCSESLQIVASLTAMKDNLRHRGPDDEGLELVELGGGVRLGLAHTRLSILDLSEAGHQPMSVPETGSWVVYNGEIYNHAELRRKIPESSFHGSSDTETLLKAWDKEGHSILGSLRGMFAFALYDGRRRQFWLVRDRLGVKPLYVCQASPGTWVFASEVRALLASSLVERRLNRSAVDAYLGFGAVPAPWTLIEGVHSLLPGEAWRFDLTGPPNPQRVRYWQPPFAKAGERRVERAEAVEQVNRVLSEAIGLRMLSDVPVGVFLSGGIDSSAVVAVLASQGHRLRTFSVTLGDRSLDESEHARRVAHRFGTEHAELLLQPRHVLEQFDQALAAYDQPSIDGLNTYFISQVTRQAGVKVALSGLGGDELFAGYSYFRYLHRLEHRWPRWIASVMCRLMELFTPRAMRTKKLAALLGATDGPLQKYAVCRQLMFPEQRMSILDSAAAELISLPGEIIDELQQGVCGLDGVNAQSFLELSLYLANMLLRDTDQMSMAHSLEVREPLLDHVLVETVARLPGAMKITPGRRGPHKGLLVDSLPAELPHATLHRPKMGFVLPWESWLRQELRPRVAHTLANRDTVSMAGLDPAGVLSLWHGFLAGDPGVRSSDVLALLHLLAWVERHAICFPSALAAV